MREGLHDAQGSLGEELKYKISLKFFVLFIFSAQNYHIYYFVVGGSVGSKPAWRGAGALLTVGSVAANGEFR